MAGDEEGVRARPKHPRQRELAEVDEEFDSPVGIDEAKVDGFSEKLRERAAPRASIGAAQFDQVRGDAKRTLKGLRWFQWSARFGTLCNYLALIAAAFVIAIIFMGAGGAYAYFDLAGIGLGLGAFALFLMAGLCVMLALYQSHRGRNELGIMQERAIRRAPHLLLRAVIVGVGGAAVAIVLGLQGETPTRSPLIENAMIYGMIVALVSSGMFASMFSEGLQRYLRNLAPKAGRHAKGVFRRRFFLATVPAITFAVAGIPQLLLEYQQACTDLGSCPGDRLLSMASPSYGPLAFLFISPFFQGIGVLALPVAALLLISRFSAIMALRTWRHQLEEAERLIVAKVRSKATPLTALAGALPPESTPAPD